MQRPVDPAKAQMAKILSFHRPIFPLRIVMVLFAQKSTARAENRLQDHRIVG